MRIKPSPLYKEIAACLNALENCKKSNNDAWHDIWQKSLDQIAKDLLPSGSGINAGTFIDIDESKPEKIVLQTSYHHMNDHGFYTGWSEHKIIVTPSLLSDFNIRITGRDKNDIKEFLYQTFDHVLSAKVVLEKFKDEYHYRFAYTDELAA